MDGRCEVECLSFEDKIGGCRAELTPFCCKKKQKNEMLSSSYKNGRSKDTLVAVISVHQISLDLLSLASKFWIL